MKRAEGETIKVEPNRVASKRAVAQLDLTEGVAKDYRDKSFERELTEETENNPVGFLASGCKSVTSVTSLSSCLTVCLSAFRLRMRFSFPAGTSRRGSSDLPVSIRCAEHVGIRRKHHIIESLGEHGCCEECDRAEGLISDVEQVVSQRGRQNKNAAWSDLMSRAVFELQLTGSGNDVLRFFGCIGMPPEAASRLNLVDNSR